MTKFQDEFFVSPADHVFLSHILSCWLNRGFRQFWKPALRERNILVIYCETTHTSQDRFPLASLISHNSVCLSPRYKAKWSIPGVRSHSMILLSHRNIFGGNLPRQTFFISTNQLTSRWLIALSALHTFSGAPQNGYTKPSPKPGFVSSVSRFVREYYS